MSKNMERIQNGTVEEVFAMVDDDELMLERPIIVAGIATTWTKAKSMSPAIGIYM